MRTTISDHGARPDGAFLNTAAIQAAIDAVAAAGGGQVVVPPGVWLTGMIRLRDRIHLHLEPGAVLKAAAKPEDHPKRDIAYGMEWNGGWKKQGRFHLLLAEGCCDIAITGLGTFDGNGTAFYPKPASDLCWPLGYADDQRMCTCVEITGCRNVRIEGITITNVAFWTLHLHDSDQVRVSGIRIENPANAPNADGIDITGCRGVAISDSFIDTCDDAVCLKTFPGGRSCEDIAVTNCILRTHCVALKFGCVESFADMRNVTFANCVVRGSHRAVGIYSLEGGIVENVRVENITCDTRAPLMFTRPIHIDLRRRRAQATGDLPASTLGALRNIRISGLTAETTGRIVMTAEPGAMLEDIRLNDIDLRYVAVDDPAIHGRTVGGSQFSNSNPWARTERAALVAENIRNLFIDGFRVRWPVGQIPASWDFAKKIANGTHEEFLPKDWTTSPVPPFAGISARQVHGGWLRGSVVSGHAGGSRVRTERCTWEA